MSEPLTTKEKTNRIRALMRQNDCIALMLEGKPTKDIKTYLIKKYAIGVGTANNIVSLCYKIIRERRKYEINNLLTMHIARYEYLYSKLYELKMFQSAQQALQAKEKLMGFHKEGFHMRVSSGTITAISMQSAQDDFNVMALDDGQRERLTFLLQKASTKKENEPTGDK